MGSIVDELEIGARVLVDTTYGPKDLPIVIFTALNFAEKFLECQIDNIIYGIKRLCIRTRSGGVANWQHLRFNFVQNY